MSEPKGCPTPGACSCTARVAELENGLQELKRGLLAYEADLTAAGPDDTNWRDVEDIAALLTRIDALLEQKP